MSSSPGFVEHRLVIPACDIPASPFVRGFGRTDLSVSVRVSADLAAWVNDLRRRAEVVWATTWEDAANIHYAPLAGIEPLPVAVSVESHFPRFGYVKNCDSVAWKVDALCEEYPDRPVVFVDDNAYWAHRRPTLREDGPPSLVLCPDAERGLTDEHRATIDAFVAAHSA